MNNLPGNPELNSSQMQYEDEIDLKELFFVLWNAKLFIVAVTGFFAVLSVVYALSLPNIYGSSALLSPRDGQGSIANLTAQYGGIAAMAGIQLPRGERDRKTSLAMEKMKSVQFFEEYLYETILVELMAAKSWELSSNILEIDKEVYDVVSGNWIRDVNPPSNSKPSMQEAYSYFDHTFSLDRDRVTGLVLITIQHISPYVAQKWVNLIVTGISNSLRQNDILEATKAITFLNAQRENTNLVNMDVIFSQLIEEQTKTIMLANVSEHYVFQVIDPPYAAERKSKPNRALICIIITLLGGMFAVLSALILHYALPNTGAKLQKIYRERIKPWSSILHYALLNTGAKLQKIYRERIKPWSSR